MSHAPSSHLTCGLLASLAPSTAQPAASAGGSGSSSGTAAARPCKPLLLPERGPDGMVQPRHGCNNALSRRKHAIAGESRTGPLRLLEVPRYEHRC